MILWTEPVLKTKVVRKHFAWVPIRVGRKIIWWQYYFVVWQYDEWLEHRLSYNVRRKHWKIVDSYILV